MKNFFSNILFFSFFICIFFSCRPDNVVSEKKMVEVLTDIQIAQGVFQAKNQDFYSVEAKDALLAGVLQKHNITEADLDSSIVYYSDNVNKLIRINDSVKANLQRTLSFLENNSNMSNYKIPDFVVLDNSTSTFSFSLSEYEISKIGNNLNWSFKPLGLHNGAKLKASVQYKYVDTTLIVTEIITTDQVQNMKAMHPSKLTQISGFIHLVQPTYSPVIIHSIRLEPSQREMIMMRPE